MARTWRPLVVCVEDWPAVQGLVEFWLEDAGFDVVVAGDGTAGLAAVREHRPDLVVTDALMPGMTGDELIEVLQADPDLREIPIIMATAAASPPRVRPVIAPGFRAGVAQPRDAAPFLHRG